MPNEELFTKVINIAMPPGITVTQRDSPSATELVLKCGYSDDLTPALRKLPGRRYQPVEHRFERQFVGKCSTKHILEKETDPRYRQEVVGHHSSKTTGIYIHLPTKNIAHIRSPLDGLF